MTRELKQFALQHEVPVVLLSQLSRNVESRKNNRPILSDLRESGNIEQDADVVLFLHRDDYYGGSRCEVSDMDVIVAKHRNGPTGSVAVRFDRECGDRKSTRLNSSHVAISYAVFCLKKQM